MLLKNNTKMKYGLAVLMVFNIFCATAKDIVWCDGTIILRSQKVLTGEISIELKHDLVLHRMGGKVNVYPAHKIDVTYMYDKDASLFRRYMSVNEPANPRIFQLYEILLTGDVSILRKHKNVALKNPLDPNGFYYFIMHKGKVLPFHKFKRNVFPHMMESAGMALTEYMKKKDLHITCDANVIKIIKFYNGYTITKSQPSVVMF
jgi:hypothetical protein